MNIAESRKITSIILMAVILLTFISAFPLTVNAITVREVGNPVQLTTALNNFADGDTIKLTDNIEYTSFISISDKDITFDLNGFILSLNSVLSVTNCAVKTVGTGKFNIDGTSVSGYNGITAADGAKITITGDVIGSDCGVYSVKESELRNEVTINGNVTGMHQDGVVVFASSVTVNGNVSGKSFGLQANGSADAKINGDVINGVRTERNAKIKITGDIKGDGGGVFAADGSKVEVIGNVTGTTVYGGVYASTDAEVTVYGNVITNNDRGIYAHAGTIRVTGNVKGGLKGVEASWNGKVTVNGDIIGGSNGVSVSGGAEVMVDGGITAPVYISVGEVLKAEEPRTYSTKLGKRNYFEYTDNESYVWVKDPSFKITANVPSGSNITVKPPCDIMGSEIVSVALYDKVGQLLELKQIKQGDSLTVTMSRLADAATIKVMWWNGIDTMQPVCESDILTKKGGSWLRSVTV